MDQNPNIKSLLEWVKNPKNRAVSKLIFLLTLGLLMLFLGKIFVGNSNKKTDHITKNINTPIEQDNNNSEQNYEMKLEKQLANLLRQVDGVGGVEVMVTLEDKLLIEPAFNIVNTEKNSEEKDNDGGVRSIIEKQTNKQAVLLRKNGEEEAMILKETTPSVKGILIVADGATSSSVKEKIIKSTAVLLDIPIYKISVLAK